MQGWIRNELVVCNLTEEGKKALANIFSHDNPFHLIYPIPGVLKNMTSPAPEYLERLLGVGDSYFQNCMDFDKTKSFVKEAGRPDPGWERIKGSFHMCRKWRKAILLSGIEAVEAGIRHDKRSDEDAAQALLKAVHAIAKTGYVNRDDWCWDKWGVPEDASDVVILEDTWFRDECDTEPDFIVRFDTFGDAPEGVIRKLSETYPDAVFHLRSADIQDFGYLGLKEYRHIEAGLVDMSQVTYDSDAFLKNLFHYTQKELDARKRLERYGG